MLKKVSLIILITAYVAAGINHFINPDFYIDIIPDYLPQPQALNYIAGICEVVFGLMLIFKQSRNLGLTLLIIMLAAFLPVHIAMVQQAPMRVNGTTITLLTAWLRCFYNRY
ncbi:MauE/DoxX family redox-associated membrane protein [uncultured Mucilaginibacter sp.]|uniref:DoxX family protein n=1 Tax=uncultured Mucilaginibacter sp. TaxID=797541 RepID=UPI0025E11EBE|nr:MauE/DoxX family redox-associated membrane protein [uncultured Mucilaginibacter sp.]